MIQRTQSIYLLLAGIAMISLIALPILIINFSAKEAVAMTIFADKVLNLHDNIALLSLAMAAGGVAIINIFLFKNRKLQITISWLAIALTLAMLGLMGYLFYSEFSLLSDTSKKLIVPGSGIANPLLAIIFLLLANKGIKKDDALVRSMDRLR